MDIIKAPLDEIIYVGCGHSAKAPCTNNQNRAYEKVLVSFQMKRGIELVLSASRCTMCGSIFLPYKKYEKHWVKIVGYSIIRSKTGTKPYQEYIKERGSMPLTNYSVSKSDYDEIFKTPNYIKYGLSHPFQGGRMSPK